MSDLFVYSLLTVSLLSLLLLCAVLIRARSNNNQLCSFSSRLDLLERDFGRQEKGMHDEFLRSREEASRSAAAARQELTASVTNMADSLLLRMSEIAGMQKHQLDIFASQLKDMAERTDSRLDNMRARIDERLQLIQEDNAKQLEMMRLTVDEKLHDTLEKRLGESFRQVSERLELVQRGLGEMQTLASGVGDLKKVLSNVKTRGTFGEIQLASLLEQVLAPGQYEANVETKAGSGQRVEFALKLPGRDGSQGGMVRLPIDAKFPQEDYIRLIESQELGDAVAAADAMKKLERTIKEMAKAIREKYLDPPHTTDFGIMFLPTEGLYAEVLRRPGLFDTLQREFRIMVAGPTTLAALLNSLQLGFRTLAIEKRSAEVWNLLGAVRTEFSKFGTLLDKTRKKIEEAGSQIDFAATRARVIEKKLRDVQDVPDAEAERLLDGTLTDTD